LSNFFCIHLVKKKTEKGWGSNVKKAGIMRWLSHVPRKAELVLSNSGGKRIHLKGEFIGEGESAEKQTKKRRQPSSRKSWKCGTQRLGKKRVGRKTRKRENPLNAQGGDIRKGEGGKKRLSRLHVMKWGNKKMEARRARGFKGESQALLFRTLTVQLGSRKEMSGAHKLGRKLRGGGRGIGDNWDLNWRYFCVLQRGWRHLWGEGNPKVQLIALEKEEAS